MVLAAAVDGVVRYARWFAAAEHGAWRGWWIVRCREHGTEGNGTPVALIRDGLCRVETGGQTRCLSWHRARHNAQAKVSYQRAWPSCCCWRRKKKGKLRNDQTSQLLSGWNVGALPLFLKQGASWQVAKNKILTTCMVPFSCGYACSLQAADACQLAVAMAEEDPEKNRGNLFPSSNSYEQQPIQIVN